MNAALTFAHVAYLSRTVGVEGWGKIVFLQLLVNYFIWFTNWGFYLHTTKKISNYRNDLNKISRIFSVTITAQFILTIIALFFVALSTFIFAERNNQLITFMIVSGLILGNVIQPLWLLSGIEKVNESAAIQMLNKLLSLPLILILIHNSLDLNKYFLINIFISFFVGICYLFWITYKHKVKFELVSVTEALDEIKQGSHLFSSLIFANLYTSLIPMVLGAFVSASSLGYYNLADRVRSLILQLFHPVTHILFPKICFLIKSDPIKAKELIIRSGFIVITISIFATFIVYFFAGRIILTISGSSFYNSINLLKILTFTIPVMTISEFLMYQYLIPTGNYDVQYRSRLFVFVLSLFFVLPAIVYNGNVGAAWLSLAMETLLIIYILFGIRGNLFNFLRKK